MPSEANNLPPSPEPNSKDFIDGGFRLHQLEVLNWGTFNKQIWKISPEGQNALLTGDIGSGKSTLVDALTTLLVPKPANQIVFNKAAGSEGQERTLASYVLGEYKSERDEVTNNSRAVALRTHSDFSVLLARFHNHSLTRTISIAQLLYFKEKGGKRVERLFVVSQEALTIQEHFNQFDDLNDLRRKLRKQGHKIPDSLKDYAKILRRSLCINSERALDLFYQTVSMKSVENLTQFVRLHMLEPGDARERVETLCKGFEDLDRAHAAVIRARKQISLLAPIVRDGAGMGSHIDIVKIFRHCRELLEAWRANHKLLLEKNNETKLKAEEAGFTQQLENLTQNLNELVQRRSSLERSLDDAGGRRLKEIEIDLQRLEQELQRRRQNANNYGKLAETLSLSVPDDNHSFNDNQRKINDLTEKTTLELDEFDNKQVEVKHQLFRVNEEIETFSTEIGAIENRPSNIPARSLQIRSRLCDALGLDEDALPFAGELIQVKDTEQIWEGTVERVLHNFGLSLLVEPQYYAEVAEYVEKTHLHSRLVYYRTGITHRNTDLRSLNPNSLVHKLQLKAENSNYNWLLQQLINRFDYACCKSLDEFRRYNKAITLKGQLKSGGDRHEKDDRHALSDRSRYILGWNNRNKLKTLENQRQQRIKQQSDLTATINRLKQEKKSLDEQRLACNVLSQIQRFSELNWQTTAEQIISLKREKADIEASSDKLRQLQDELHKVKQVTSDKEQKRESKRQQLADCRSEITQCQKNQAEAEEQLLLYPKERRNYYFPLIEKRYLLLFTDLPSLRNLSKREKELRESLQIDIDKHDAKIRKLRDSIIRSMQEYCQEYKAETTETDATIEALGDYQNFLAALQEDDLPRFEEKFKQELNEKTIQSLVHFSNQLERAKQSISNKIAIINKSLLDIDYNEGSFIQLVTTLVNDSEIREFQQSLRACLSDTLSDQLYDETRFLQVREVIERFKGREGSIEADKRWTKKVTEVRNWYTFAAQELWREDNTERDYHESSSGKSGGQKEKLAYTILASALAYQFGLDKPNNPRSYRFVAIDEAFGRGSETSTQYALELFKKLGLQLLVVTPLQKIHVIEHYVNHVHFVHNQEGKKSMLRNMTIEEYQKTKAQQSDTRLEKTLHELVFE